MNELGLSRRSLIAVAATGGLGSFWLFRAFSKEHENTNNLPNSERPAQSNIHHQQTPEVCTPKNIGNDDGNSKTEFLVESGDGVPADWGYPVTVRFENTDSGEIHTATADECEGFAVDLEPGDQYLITATPVDGREREFGVYTNYESQDEPVHLVAFPGGW